MRTQCLEYQLIRNAVEHRRVYRCALRVVAGPGTGKTYALMRRVARLLEQYVQPNRVLAISFTRTAANDLVDKLAQLGAPGADELAAKTPHSLSFGLLSRNSVFQMLGRVARPVFQSR